MDKHSLLNTPRSPHKRNFDGFTLVEVLSAALIGAMVMVSISGLIGTSTLNRASLMRQVESQSQYQRLHQALDSLCRRTQIPYWTKLHAQGEGERILVPCLDGDSSQMWSIVQHDGGITISLGETILFRAMDSQCKVSLWPDPENPQGLGLSLPEEFRDSPLVYRFAMHGTGK